MKRCCLAIFIVSMFEGALLAQDSPNVIFLVPDDIIPVEQSSYRNEGFLMLGEIVSGAAPEDTSNDRLLAVLRVGHIARYAPSLRLATSQSFAVIPPI